MSEEPKKTSLENIRLLSHRFGNDEADYEIKIDWGNDRHHGIELKTLEPSDVINALKIAIESIELDIYYGFLNAE